MVAYMPYKLSCHRIATDLMQPWVIGFQRNPFVRSSGFLDVDPACARGGEVSRRAPARRSPALPPPGMAGPAACEAEEACFAISSLIAETGFDPARMDDIYSRSSPPTSSTACSDDYRCAAVALVAPNVAVGMPESSTTSAPGPCASRKASSSTTTRPSGPQARAGGAGFRLLSSGASSTRRNKQPRLRERPERACSGWSAARAAREEALRLRPRGRGPARAGPLHRQFQAGGAAAALHLHRSPRVTCSARWRAR